MHLSVCPVLKQLTIWESVLSGGKEEKAWNPHKMVIKLVLEI